MSVVRLLQLNVNRISLLTFNNLQTAVSYVPTVGSHARLNLVLIPGFDANAGIVRLDAQLGFAGQVISFRPIVGVSEGGKGCAGDQDNEQRQADFAHGGGSPDL